MSEFIFGKIETELKDIFSDESIKFSYEISGGIVNRAALYSSQLNQSARSYFVKYNSTPVARRLFESESHSLKLLAQTHCVNVPSSYKVFSCKESPGAVHVLEFLPGLKPLSDFWPQFGQQIGQLHALNNQLIQQAKKGLQSIHQHGDTASMSLVPVEKFGGNWEHFMGTFTPGSGWRSSWQEMFIGDILAPLVDGVVEKYRDTLLQEKWSWLQRHLHKLFSSLPVVPSINHGDLCVANCGQTDQGPVIFDPSVWYGHNQLDLIIPHCEETFHKDFYEEYHRIIPKGPLWDECMLAYELFYNVVMLYHVEDKKMKCDMHRKADLVKEMLCKQFGAC